MQNMVIKHLAMNRNTEVWLRNGIGIMQKKQNIGIDNPYHVHLEFKTGRTFWSHPCHPPRTF